MLLDISIFLEFFFFFEKIVQLGGNFLGSVLALLFLKEAPIGGIKECKTSSCYHIAVLPFIRGGVLFRNKVPMPLCYA